MKKSIIICASVLLLTGCGSKIRCSQDLKQDSITVKASIIANVKKDKIQDFSVEYKFPSEKDAEKLCKIMTKAKCSGKTVKLVGDSALSELGLTKDKLKDTYKDDFIKTMEDNNFECKKE